jgi:hypothetical protein
MLIYNPAFDVQNSIFRALVLVKYFPNEIEIDRFRIFDYYLLFPAELLEIDRYRGFKSNIPYLESLFNKFERIQDGRKVFAKMEEIQTSALRTLVSYGFLESDRFSEGRILCTSKTIPNAIVELIDKKIDANRKLLEILKKAPLEMNLFGPKGLKARTGLLEFVYD